MFSLHPVGTRPDNKSKTSKANQEYKIRFLLLTYLKFLSNAQRISDVDNLYRNKILLLCFPLKFLC